MPSDYLTAIKIDNPKVSQQQKQTYTSKTVSEPWKDIPFRYSALGDSTHSDGQPGGSLMIEEAKSLSRRKELVQARPVLENSQEAASHI